MANELLDFVMSLVRDSDAAARYAANPDRVLADAGLTGVTSTDVGNLLPVVADSLAMTGPSVGDTGLTGTTAGNVWTGGAATAAFDAFTPTHTPAPVAVHQPVIDPHDVSAPASTDPVFGTDLQVNTDSPVAGAVLDPGHDPASVWDDPGHAAADPHVPFEHHVVDDPGFSGFELLD